MEVLNESSLSMTMTIDDDEKAPIVFKGHPVDFNRAPRDIDGNIGRLLVTRDQIMWVDDVKFYDFKSNQYFPTATEAELEAIRQRGPVKVPSGFRGQSCIANMRGGGTFNIF
jgi:hypothetical protein